jgi:hypothetical protein
MQLTPSNNDVPKRDTTNRGSFAKASIMNAPQEIQSQIRHRRSSQPSEMTSQKAVDTQPEQEGSHPAGPPRVRALPARSSNLSKHRAETQPIINARSTPLMQTLQVSRRQRRPLLVQRLHLTKSLNKTHRLPGRTHHRQLSDHLVQRSSLKRTWKWRRRSEGIFLLRWEKRGQKRKERRTCWMKSLIGMCVQFWMGGIVGDLIEEACPVGSSMRMMKRAVKRAHQARPFR